MCEQPDRVLQVRASLGVLVVVCSHPIVDRLQLSADAGSFLLEQVQRHGIVRLQQLDPFVVETITVSGEAGQLLDSSGARAALNRARSIANDDPTSEQMRPTPTTRSVRSL